MGSSGVSAGPPLSLARQAWPRSAPFASLPRSGEAGALPAGVEFGLEADAAAAAAAAAETTLRRTSLLPLTLPFFRHPHPNEPPLHLVEYLAKRLAAQAQEALERRRRRERRRVLRRADAGGKGSRGGGEGASGGWTATVGDAVGGMRAEDDLGELLCDVPLPLHTSHLFILGANRV